MQAQRDNGPGSVPFSGAGSGPGIDYYVQFTVPVIDRVYMRWDGHDGLSDSIYAGIATDATFTSFLDWFEDYSHITSDFAQLGWDRSGQSQVNVANALFKVPENNGQLLPPQPQRAISLRPLTALQRFIRSETKEQ